MVTEVVVFPTVFKLCCTEALISSTQPAKVTTYHVSIAPRFPTTLAGHRVRYYTGACSDDRIPADILETFPTKQLASSIDVFFVKDARLLGITAFFYKWRACHSEF
jgi:hypothetical protein